MVYLCIKPHFLQNLTMKKEKGKTYNKLNSSSQSEISNTKENSDIKDNKANHKSENAEQSGKTDQPMSVTEENSSNPDETSAEGSLDKLEKKIEKLAEDLNKKNEECLRAYAEIQNLQRRHQQDLEKTNKYGVEKLAKDLLPIIDTLEKSLEHVAQEEEKENNKEILSPIKDGLELTVKMFFDMLKKWNLEKINPQGEAFDPNLHEAMSMIVANEYPNGSIVNVIMPGYKLHDRVLRPAMVVVAKNEEPLSKTDDKK